MREAGGLSKEGGVTLICDLGGTKSRRIQMASPQPGLLQNSQPYVPEDKYDFQFICKDAVSSRSLRTSRKSLATVKGI